MWKEEREGGEKNRYQEGMEKQQANYMASANHWERSIMTIDGQGWTGRQTGRQTDRHTHTHP